MLIPTKDPNKKLYINSGIVTIIVLVLVGATGYQLQASVKASKEKESCKYFKTQQEAQIKYDRYINSEYSKTIKQLDRDHDGVACEALPTK